MPGPSLPDTNAFFRIKTSWGQQRLEITDYYQTAFTNQVKRWKKIGKDEYEALPGIRIHTRLGHLLRLPFGKSSQVTLNGKTFFINTNSYNNFRELHLEELIANQVANRTVKKLTPGAVRSELNKLNCLLNTTITKRDRKAGMANATHSLQLADLGRSFYGNDDYMRLAFNLLMHASIDRDCKGKYLKLNDNLRADRNISIESLQKEGKESMVKTLKEKKEQLKKTPEGSPDVLPIQAEINELELKLGLLRKVKSYYYPEITAPFHYSISRDLFSTSFLQNDPIAAKEAFDDLAKKYGDDFYHNFFSSSKENRDYKQFAAMFLLPLSLALRSNCEHYPKKVVEPILEEAFDKIKAELTEESIYENNTLDAISMLTAFEILSNYSTKYEEIILFADLLSECFEDATSPEKKLYLQVGGSFPGRFEEEGEGKEINGELFWLMNFILDKKKKDVFEGRIHSAIDEALKSKEKPLLDSTSDLYVSFGPNGKRAIDAIAPFAELIRDRFLKGAKLIDLFATLPPTEEPPAVPEPLIETPKTAYTPIDETQRKKNINSYLKELSEIPIPGRLDPPMLDEEMDGLKWIRDKNDYVKLLYTQKPNSSKEGDCVPGALVQALFTPLIPGIDHSTDPAKLLMIRKAISLYMEEHPEEFYSYFDLKKGKESETDQLLAIMEAAKKIRMPSQYVGAEAFQAISSIVCRPIHIFEYGDKQVQKERDGSIKMIAKFNDHFDSEPIVLGLAVDHYYFVEPKRTGKEPLA